MTERQTGGIRGRLVVLVNEIIGQAPSTELPADRQLSDLGLSSIKMVNLMLGVEAAFDITIPQADITPENFHSLLSIEAMVSRLAGTIEAE